MEEYVSTYLKLLAGEVAEWEGAPLQMLLRGTSWEGVLPLHISLIMSGMGPEGDAVSRRLGAEGMISLLHVTPQQAAHERRVVVAMGTVLDDGATEIQFQPTGPDIPRELERFMAAALKA